jgi:hypothetical protein
MLKKNGQLSRKDIVDGLYALSQTMPKSIRYYLASVLESRGKFARSIDGEKQITRLERRDYLRPILDRYIRYVGHIDPKRTDVLREFIEKTAKKYDLSTRQVDEILYPRKPKG